MDKPINFLLTPSSQSYQPSHVDETPEMVRFLDIFEIHCVVGCCEWGAIAATTDDIRAALTLHQATVEEAQGLVDQLLRWNQVLTDPVIVTKSGWLWDPKDSEQNLRQFSVILHEISGQTSGPPC